MFGAQPAADVAFFARGAALLESGYQLAPRAGEMDRRDGLKPGNRFLGRVVGCNGSRATIAAVAENGETSLTELWSVGKLVSISVGSNRVVALVYSMQTISEGWGEEASNTFRIEVELMGEVQVGPDGREAFSAGISRYPYLGAIAHRIRVSDLARIYDPGQSDSCVIGKLTQDESLDATIHVHCFQRDTAEFTVNALNLFTGVPQRRARTWTRAEDRSGPGLLRRRSTAPPGHEMHSVTVFLAALQVFFEHLFENRRVDLGEACVAIHFGLHFGNVEDIGHDAACLPLEIVTEAGPVDKQGCDQRGKERDNQQSAEGNQYSRQHRVTFPSVRSPSALRL